MDFAGDSNSESADYELAVLHLQYSQLVSCSTIAGLANSKFKIWRYLFTIYTFYFAQIPLFDGAQHFQ
jgi:hypothetical protein